MKTEESKDTRDLMFKKSRSESKKKQVLMPIKPSDPKPLNKNDMFDYFKNGICGRDPQKKPTDKIILVLEEFNKIYIVQCSVCSRCSYKRLGQMLHPSLRDEYTQRYRLCSFCGYIWSRR